MCCKGLNYYMGAFEHFESRGKALLRIIDIIVIVIIIIIITFIIIIITIIVIINVIVFHIQGKIMW